MKPKVEEVGMRKDETKSGSQLKVRIWFFGNNFCPAVGLSLVEYIRRHWCSLL